MLQQSSVVTVIEKDTETAVF